MSTDIPSSEQLRNLYYELKKKHLSYLLPLESELPDCLKYNNRDEYRTTITMILSEQMSDYELSAALGPFFRDYPNLASLRHIMNSQEAKKILRKYGFATEGSRWEHNVASVLCV